MWCGADSIQLSKKDFLNDLFVVLFVVLFVYLSNPGVIMGVLAECYLWGSFALKSKVREQKSPMCGLKPQSTWKTRNVFLLYLCHP